jgi:hypothetical protein
VGRRERQTSASRSIAGATVLLVLLPVLTVLSSSDAHADTVGGVQASVAALQAQITTQSAQIHQWTSDYEQATLQIASLSQQISADRASIGVLRSRVSDTQSTLRQVALRSYMSGQATVVSIKTDSSASELSVEDEYLSVAAGNVGDTVDRLMLEQRALRTATDTLTQEQQAAAAAASTANNARNEALATASQEQTQLTSLQSELQQLITAQSVAEAAAAARARARASQGAPVNGGLVSVVRSIVSAPATTTSTPPPASTTPTSTVPSGGGSTSTAFAELRQCESGDNYQEDTGNGFYGAYQFSAATWSGLGFPGRPDQEPPGMQDQAAEELQAQRGWGQWPACAAALGL